MQVAFLLCTSFGIFQMRIMIISSLYFGILLKIKQGTIWKGFNSFKVLNVKWLNSEYLAAEQWARWNVMWSNFILQKSWVTSLHNTYTFYSVYWVPLWDRYWSNKKEKVNCLEEPVILQKSIYMTIILA
jgi:hypothetical protein